MGEALAIAARNSPTPFYVVDDTMTMLGQRSHRLVGLSAPPEVLTVAVLAALYVDNHHERAVGVLSGRAHRQQVCPARDRALAR